MHLACLPLAMLMIRLHLWQYHSDKPLACVLHFTKLISCLLLMALLNHIKKCLSRGKTKKIEKCFI